MRSLLLLPLVLLSLPLSAQQPTHGCAGVAEPAARLACYDEAFPPLPEAIEAATARARADFGLDRQPDPLRNPGQSAQQADPERIESRVVKVDHDGATQSGFHLENGQVWVRAQSGSSGRVQAGDSVQVRKGLMGSYQLVTPNGVTFRVRRIR